MRRDPQKPEVHNVLQYNQKSTEAWPQATWVENLGSLDMLIFYTRGQTHADRNTSHPYWERQVSTVANGPAQRNRAVDRLAVDCRSSEVLST